MAVHGLVVLEIVGVEAQAQGQQAPGLVALPAQGPVVDGRRTPQPSLTVGDQLARGRRHGRNLNRPGRILGHVANRPVRSIPDRAAAKAVTMMSDRVLVRRPDDEGERRSKGGLVIPATAATVSKRGQWATVVAVGPNVRNVEPEDEVLLLPDSGIEVEIRGEEYLLVREREIHAVASERGDPRTGLYL
jgi:chaperonin GroES